MPKHTPSGFPARHNFAQTNIQLINQLEGVYTGDEIDRVRSAYELCCDLFAGQFRSSGKAFIAHLIGTASILSWARAPVATINAGMLHAAYMNGNFGSRTGGDPPEHRKHIRDRVGEQTERLIYEYTNLPWRSTAAIPRISKQAPGLSTLEHQVILIRLANELEEYLDLGVLHSPDAAQRVQFSRLYGRYIVDLAKLLGHTELAGLLRKAFAHAGGSVAPGPDPAADTLPRVNEIPRSNSQSGLNDELPIISRDALQNSVTHQFERQVALHPDNTAIEQHETRLTYRELRQRVERVAARLLTQTGSGNDPVVALCAHGVNMVVAALAVLKTGKIFVPLDSAHPVERLSLIVKDAGSANMLVDDAHLELARSLTGFDGNLMGLSEALDHNVPVLQFPVVPPESVACVLYTSGTTGVPKGVVHNHRNLVHLAFRGIEALRITPRDRLTLLPSCSQIAGITDLLRALLSGATLLPYDVRREPITGVGPWMNDKQITIFHSSPTFLRLMAENFSQTDRFPGVRLIHMGGETMTQSDVRNCKTHFSTDCTVLNNFGCTELSGFCQYFLGPGTACDTNAIPVGYPVEDVQVSIHDQQRATLPPGQIGEIVVTSPYVALGYWRRPDETKTVFEHNADGTRSYRTGDLGYLLDDGCLVYAGRNDGQAQIHGNRVNTAEIESVLSVHSAVRQVAVKASQDRPHTLTAYIVARGPSAPSVEQLRGFARNKLPTYMLPSIIFVEELPLTPNGKIDFGRLEQTRTLHAGHPDRSPPPSGPIEQLLAESWSGLLEGRAISSQDDFFALGGDSLLASRLSNHIEDIFDIRIGLHDIFENPTLASLATAVGARYIGNAFSGMNDAGQRLLLDALTQIENAAKDPADLQAGSA